ncbi:TIGR02117 family protein [Rhizobium sp. KVB221]|uniref:TIGR02117 family protein n=1 Tax=Rhizobium setariae TaxID=2801340 RepID=A0A936YQP6_9HYPH|nr:TIGR02117 family protein [Rhizobium setariae]MBL0372469.1 TIGR02117 family protein [Rhizobium setariae]
MAIRVWRRLLTGTLLVALLIAVGTFLPRPLWPTAEAAGSSTETRQILVLSNPIHTDIAIPVDAAIRARFGFLSAAGVPIDNPAVRYLVFGWGGRSFYLETPRWADLKPLPVLRALTIDKSVMHVDVAGMLPVDAPAITRHEVDEAGFERMLVFIQSSFALDKETPVPIPGAGYGRYDAFFEANGFFNILVGCNTWTAWALREAGLRTGLWNPIPQTLAVSLKLYN